MKKVFQTSHFKRDIKKLKKRGKELSKLADVLKELEKGIELEERYGDHALTGRWSGSQNCHIEPDWILIYRKAEDTLYLERSGSHSDLFK